MRCNEAAPYYLDRMTRAWVPLALTEGGLLDALFLAACRQIHRSCQRPQQQQQFMQLACHYKVACIKSLSDSISVEVVFSDATVAKTLMLAYDEVRIRHSINSKEPNLTFKSWPLLTSPCTGTMLKQLSEWSI